MTDCVGMRMRRRTCCYDHYGHVGDVVLPQNGVGGAALPSWQKGLLRYAYLLSFHLQACRLHSRALALLKCINCACFHSVCVEMAE